MISDNSVWRKVGMHMNEEHPCQTCMREDGDADRLRAAGRQEEPLVPFSKEEATRWHRDGWFCESSPDARETGTSYCQRHFILLTSEDPEEERLKKG